MDNPLLEPGDVVTADSWDGFTSTVRNVDRDRFSEPIAFFVEGGFWREGQLRKVIRTAPEEPR